MATQTARHLDSSALYQLLTNITLARLDQLELQHSRGHLPSRDPPPANQRRRTISLPAYDVTRHDVSQPQHPRRHHSNSEAPKESCVTPDVKSPPRVKSPSHLDIFKKLQPSRRRRADVIVTCRRRPIAARRDAVPADVTADAMTSPKLSSFDRLNRRRNGLVDPTCLQ